MKKQKYPKQSLQNSLEEILAFTKDKEEIQLGQILNILALRGSAAILIILSLPFCIPIQIPGFSTPFGIILCFIGLQLAFAQRLWWPKWILEKNVKSELVNNLVQKTISPLKWVQKILYPRLMILTLNPLFQRLNGLVIFVMALLLSLPLPIPMTNMLAAAPILCIGLALLENDGVFIIIGYILAITYVVVFSSLFLYGLFYLQKAF